LRERGRGWGVIPEEGILVPREYVWLECSETGLRNYRVPKETRGTERLELMKYCPKLRRHTLHKESRKK
jgi:large subunit ribosomal protein L33